jgi:hypothetical protein
MACSVARLLGIIIAIVSTFVAIPQAAAILLILGGVSILSYKPEDYVRIYTSAIVLILGAQVLGEIPTIGTPLGTIFSNLGTFLIGSSVVAIGLRAFTLIRSDWVKA